MRAKKFTSQDGWYSLMLPADWEEYDDGEENTHAFFNAESWTGSLRITTLHWTNTANEDKAVQFVAEEVIENEGATLIKIGEFECANFKTDIVQDGEDLTMHFWTLGKNNNLFICSFTTDKKQVMTKESESDLEEVQNIISSIRVN